MEHVGRLFRSSPEKRAQRVTRDRPYQPSVRPSFFSSFLPPFSPLFSLFPPSPHPLITPLNLPIFPSSHPLCSAVHHREKKRNPSSPLFPLNGQSFFFFAVRYWARQLGNRRHFRTVQAQPTHICPHISSTHPRPFSIQPTNPFFSPHRTCSLLSSTHDSSDNTSLLSAHSYFPSSPVLVTKEDTIFLVITSSTCPTKSVSHPPRKKSRRKKKKKKSSSARFQSPLFFLYLGTRSAPRPRSLPPAPSPLCLSALF